MIILMTQNRHCDRFGHSFERIVVWQKMPLPATVNELARPYDVTVQAVSKHIRVLEDAGLVTRSRHAQRRPVHLEAEVFDLMTKWIERHRQRLEERYRRLDELLQAMPDEPDTVPETEAGEKR